MSVPYYPQYTVTPILGLNLHGMDEVVAQNFIILDSAISGGGGGGTPGGTTGQVQYNNAGAFGGIAEGTSGWVLTSNGAGVPPSFQAASSGTSVLVNGSSISNPNFNNTTPAAPAGGVNVLWQVSGSSVSAYILNSSLAPAWSSLTGTLSNGQVIPYADAGISRLGAASLAIGSGTNGDITGTLTLAVENVGNPISTLPAGLQALIWDNSPGFPFAISAQLISTDIPAAIQGVISGDNSGAAIVGFSYTETSIDRSGQCSAGFFNSNLIATSSQTNGIFCLDAECYVTPSVGTTTPWAVGLYGLAANKGAGTVTSLYGVVGDCAKFSSGGATSTARFYSYGRTSGHIGVGSSLNTGYYAEDLGARGVGASLNAAFYAEDQQASALDYAIYLVGGRVFLGKADQTGLVFGGSSSGSATVKVAAAAGTPNALVLPTATAAGSGYVLTSNGANPQQLSWTNPSSLGVAWSSLTGTLSNGQVIPYADAGISRLGATSLAIGNGTNGSITGQITLRATNVGDPLASFPAGAQALMWDNSASFPYAITGQLVAPASTQSVGVQGVVSGGTDEVVIGVLGIGYTETTALMNGSTTGGSFESRMVTTVDQPIAGVYALQGYGEAEPAVGTTTKFAVGVYGLASNTGVGRTTLLIGINGDISANFGGGTATTTARFYGSGRGSGYIGVGDTLNTQFYAEDIGARGVGASLNAAFYSEDQRSSALDYAIYLVGGRVFLGKADQTGLVFGGSSSGSATIKVAAAAGTPNHLVLPTTTGSAGQVLTTDGANPQQLSWSSSVPTAASVNATAQTASIGTSNLVASATAGVYRISYYMKITTAGSTSGSVTLTLSYTDRDDSVVVTYVVPTPANATDSSSVVSGTLIVDAKTATAITYATTYASSGGTAMVYKLRLKCESL